MNKILIPALSVALLGISLGGVAEPRHVHINGEHLSDEEILLADQMWGAELPNAFYWLNFDTGEWGYEGQDQAAGVLVPQNSSDGNQASDSNGSSRPIISTEPTGSVVIGEKCSYASVGGTSVRLCD